MEAMTPGTGKDRMGLDAASVAAEASIEVLHEERVEGTPAIATTMAEGGEASNSPSSTVMNMETSSYLGSSTRERMWTYPRRLETSMNNAEAMAARAVKSLWGKEIREVFRRWTETTPAKSRDPTRTR